MTPLEVMRSKVVVVGSCIVDHVVEVPRLPVNGETIIAERVTTTLGGKGANQAAALARLRNEVVFVSSVGSDADGDWFESSLRSEGIALALFRSAKHRTGLGIPLITPHGEKAIVVAPGAAFDLPRVFLEGVLELHNDADAFLLQLETSDEALDATLSYCRSRGIPSVVNVAPIVEGRQQSLRQADYLIMNASEASWLSGLAVDSVERASHAAKIIAESFQSRATIITLGCLGSVFRGEGTSGHTEAVPSNVKDRTGAGDAFCAGFTAARLQGYGVEQACLYASVCSSIACEGYGALQSMPSLDAVDDRISRKDSAC
jgi:ribokinase